MNFIEILIMDSQFFKPGDLISEYLLKIKLSVKTGICLGTNFFRLATRFNFKNLQSRSVVGVAIFF